MIIIKRNVAVILSVNPDDSDYLHRKRNGIDYATVNFQQTADEQIELLLGDTVEVFGKQYFLNKLPQPTRISARQYKYSCIFEAEHYALKRVRYQFLDIANGLTERAFTITGNLSVFCGLIILNLNRRFPNVWSFGNIEDTEAKTISFSRNNCLEAINILVDQFQVEFWAEGNVLNLATRNIDSGLEFSYGIRKGLTGIQRNNREDDDDMPVTHLYAYGGTRNLPEGYRNYAQTLQLNAPLVLDPNPNNYPENEDDVEFPEVYPQYVATVSEVDNEFTFYCEDLPFNLTEHLIPDLKAKVTFQTGQLAGYELEIATYDNATKQFVINTLKSETNLVVPSTSISAEVGDTFIITDMSMPEEFITEAEAKLTLFAQDYLDKNSLPKVTYTVAPDQKYFKDNQIVLNVGTKVRLIDSGMNLNRLINIESFKRYIKSPWAYELELADNPVVSLATRLIRQQIKQANELKPPSPNQSPKVFIFERSLAFIRNNCGGSLVGSEVVFKRKYVSNVSFADASNLSTLDNARFLLDGQANANEKGTCLLPKPIIYLIVQQIHNTGNIAEFTVQSSQNVNSEITVTVTVVGDISGAFQTGTVIFTPETNQSSGFTSNTNGDFVVQDLLTGGVTDITPAEDDAYRYYAG